MPSNFTEHYQLSQWEAADQVKREDFNADNAKIDAALSQKAEASALTALTQVVNKKGNCQIVMGQYTGDGTYGQHIPKTLTFDKKPVLVLVSGIDTLFAARGCGNGYILSNGTSRSIYTIWGDKSYSFYSRSNASEHMNTSGTTYFYIAFLEA